jgi:double-stranded uracil-DNA glycosylase
MTLWKPTREQIRAAHGKTVQDIIVPGLKVLFCGINPSLYTAAVGHHFARPGNRFWRTLYVSGFTDRLLSPFEDYALLAYGYGITNVVHRATSKAHELSTEEYLEGIKRLEAKVLAFHPRVLVFLGISAYRIAFAEKSASVGRQDRRVGGVEVWVLPNPSGLNASYPPKALKMSFRRLHSAIQGSGMPYNNLIRTRRMKKL